MKRLAAAFVIVRRVAELRRAAPSVVRPFLSALMVLGFFVGVAYAATLTATINHNIAVSYRGTNSLGPVTFSLTDSLQQAIRLESGTGSGQSDLIYAATRTIVASSSENLDLAGALVDPVGTTLTFVQIKVIKVCANPNNTNNVVIGGAGSNTFTGPFGAATHTIAVRPGGCFVWIAPKTGPSVVPVTGDLLQIANSGAGTSVTYDVIVIGTSA
jgi:hypothetical protein